nr:hypothetical protein GCM10020092_030740 [Actinoplanes digitatis]
MLSATSSAVRDDADPVAELLHLGHQVAGEQHGAAGRAEAPHEQAHVGHPRRVEAVCRLVEHHQARVLQQGGGHAEPLLHAQRVGGVAVAGPAGQLDLVEHGRDPVGRNAGVAGQHAQVVAAAQVRVEGRALDQRADTVEAPGRGAEQAYLSRGGPDEAEQHAQGRGLA